MSAFIFKVLFVSISIGILISNEKVAFAQDKLLPLENHYVVNPVRVFYTTRGRDAVPLNDLDRNGVPDRVEDVAKQVWAAHHLFCKVLKFPDPLGSERYRKVNCIQVSLRNLGGGNGLAFDESQRARNIPQGHPSDRAIVMRINCTLNPIKNVTPAHETFHLVQYGATYFKNKWYLEGMARWAEHALAKDGLGDVRYPPDGPWPQTLLHQSQLARMKYDAEHVLWNPIARKTDRDGQLSSKLLGKELAALRYSDASPVMRDRTLFGYKVMRDIIIELGKIDDVAMTDLKYDRWSERNQGAEQNNPYIYKGVMDAFRRYEPSVEPYEVPTINRKMNVTSTNEAFEVGSVWNGEGNFETFKFKVLAKNGDRFKARFESKSWVREVAGTRRGDSLSWRVEDVQVIKGTAGGDNEGTIVRDDQGFRIDFTWRNRNSQGEFTLRKEER